MEIVSFNSFNLEATIDFVWSNWKQKQDNFVNAQQMAEQEASKLLASQFQLDLDDCLDRQFQTALNLQILPSKEFSVFSVTAYFNYKGVSFYLCRVRILDTLHWELNYLSKSIPCLPEFLKTQILIELGRIKNDSVLVVTSHET